MKYRVRVDIDFLNSIGMQNEMDIYIKKYGIKKVKRAIREWVLANADGAFDTMDMLIEMEGGK